MKKSVYGYIRENLKYLILITVFLTAGIVTGAYTSTQYDEETVRRVTDFFNSSLVIIKANSPNLNDVFRTAFLNSLKSAGFIWLLGFTVVGAVIILFVIMKCGFMMGFISAMLMNVFSFKGIPAAVICIFSQCLLFVPAVYLLSCEAMKLSALIFSLITGRIKCRIDFRQYLIKYVLLFGIIILVMIFYSLCEAYIGANILKLYVGN